MQRLNRMLHQPGFHVFCFFLFLFILVWPILAIPGSQALAAFFKYLFIAWCVMISLLYMLASSLDESDSDQDRNPPGGRPRV